RPERGTELRLVVVHRREKRVGIPGVTGGLRREIRDVAGLERGGETEDVLRRGAAAVHADDREPGRRRLDAVSQHWLRGMRIGRRVRHWPVIPSDIMTTVTTASWPALPLQDWKDTYDTLHMWMQVVGKISLALTPKSNHFWNTAFHLTPRRLTTQTLRSGNTTFTILVDFVAHGLSIQCADGSTLSIPLEPRTVADFYRIVMDSLERMGIKVRVWTLPSEVPNPIRFEQDVVHRAYDPTFANRFWRVLVAIAPVFTVFRCTFIGKSSPVHFFWGSFDLAS